MITYNNSGSAGRSFSRLKVWAAIDVNDEPGVAFEVAANPHDGSCVLDHTQVKHLRDQLAAWIREHPTNNPIEGDTLDGR